MAEEYQMVRLRKRTHARLVEEARRLVRAMEVGQTPDSRATIDNPNPDVQGITLDSLIWRLLEGRQAHRDRVNASRRRQRRLNEGRLDSLLKGGAQ